MTYPGPISDQILRERIEELDHCIEVIEKRKEELEYQLRRDIERDALEVCDCGQFDDIRPCNEECRKPWPVEKNCPCDSKGEFWGTPGASCLGHRDDCPN